MKGAVKATGNAMKGAAKTAVKGAIAGTAKECQADGIHSCRRDSCVREQSRSGG